MAKKKVIVSRSGLTTCPSCMSHITLDASLAHTECPFCHTNLVAERNQDEGVFGQRVMQVLEGSKSAMLAAALGVSLSMAACGDHGNPIPPYGLPPIDEQDMSGDDDMTVEDMDSDERPTDMAIYGAPPVDSN